MQVLGDCTQFRLMQLLRRREAGVRDLMTTLGMDQALLSSHLRKLCERGLGRTLQAAMMLTATHIACSS
jgi:DNA-binding MarR family transcriptional regulator